MSTNKAKVTASTPPPPIPQAIPTTESALSALAEYEKLKAQADHIRSRAHDELKAAIDSAVLKLKSLGYAYKLVEDGETTSETTGKRRKNPNPECQFCKSQGKDANHDGRRHAKDRKDPVYKAWYEQRKKAAAKKK